MTRPPGNDPPSSSPSPQPAFDFFDRPAAELAAPLLAAHSTAGQGIGPGEVLGPYRIVREVGHGGMAAVYLADDPRHGRQVALKVVDAAVAAAVGRQRFLQEIQVAARLLHPHILPVFDSGESAGRLWYAMPYVAGETLRHRLSGEPRLPIGEAVRIAREVSLALDYAHREGIIHRDIKPANILLADGQALVADFGIARALHREPSAGDGVTAEGLTETGLAIGTPAYMSPEQVSGSRELDPRTDIYALSCVLYEMLAGQPPFRGTSAASVLHQHLTGDPPPITDVRPEVPAGIAAVLARGMARIPADRYATAAEFADALADSQSGQPAVRRPLISLRRWRRSRRATAILLGSLAALAVVLTYFGKSPAGSAGLTVHPMASTIAVLPLVPVPQDTALARLGRELVVTLSANLDGVGGIHAAEPVTVLALVRDGETMPPERGAELARRLGARSVLQGTLVREGPNVRLDVHLLAAENLKPLAHATVSARLGDITALTDSTTLAVIKDIWRGGNAPAPSLAAITTHSVPALRAYLEGELAFARAEFDDAVPAFERAFAADSTFWYAYWRSLYPREYEGTPPDSATLAALFKHRYELPEADRLLLESDRAKTMSEHLALLRQVTSRFPTYWPGWWNYANYLVHWTPYIGVQNEDTRRALERTLQLNPGFAPAWEHLFWIAGDQRDTAGDGRALRTLERMSSATAFRLNPEFINYYRMLFGLTASGGTFSASELQRQARYILGYRGNLPPIAFGIGLLGPGFPLAQRQISDAVLALGPGRELAAAMWAGIGFSFAGRGAWDSAVVAMHQWVRLSEDSTAPLVAYGLAVTGARLGFLTPPAVAAVRPVAVTGGPPLTVEGKAELAWLDGILAHARGDVETLARARREIRASGSRYTDLLDRSLAAFQIDLGGQRERAARALAALEWESAEHTAHHDYGRHHPFFNAVNRLTASSWLLAAGDTAQAARLLIWTEAIFWYEQHRFLLTVNKTVAPIAYFERARIEASLGQSASADALYREFVQRYDLARGEWAARVEEAIGALHRQGSHRTEPSRGADTLPRAAD